jgi:hypothetical protein
MAPARQPAMPQVLSRWLPLVLLTLAALGLRARDLSSRPMHADEANQAVRAGELLESGRYEYDPQDHHGPVLYYAVLPIARLRGQRTLAGLDELTLRLVPALAGAASVFLLGLLAAPLGRWPSLAAAAFLAASPPAVYYSRYFVQETLLGTFTLAALVCAGRWWTTGRAALVGCGRGLLGPDAGHEGERAPICRRGAHGLPRRPPPAGSRRGGPSRAGQPDRSRVGPCGGGPRSIPRSERTFRAWATRPGPTGSRRPGSPAETPDTRNPGGIFSGCS